MLNVFALGAVGGLLCGVVKHTCFPGTGKSSRPPATGSSMVDTTPEAGTRRKRITVLKENKLLAAGVGTLCACGVAAAFMVVRQQQCSRQPGTRSKARQRTDGRIPLQDLIRFKERQWFVEELENAREADPNAILRLAKMYLHGQGCQRNIALAQEWVRKARTMGVPASLDELFATDDPDPRGKLRALMAQEERRRAMRRMGAAGATAYQQRQQGQYTAAA